MKFFIDTANVDHIKEIASWGIIDGVTTNPSLIAKEGKVFEDVIKEITDIVDGPISAEVISLVSTEMIEEAKVLAKIHKNIVIKVPMTEEGLKAVSVLSKLHIKTNVTLIFSATQALLAAKAGATYVSPFLGRLDDISSDGMKLVEEIVDIYRNYNIQTEVIAASVRTPMHVKEIALVGADISTIPYNVFLQMLKHPLTDSGIAKFLDDWKSVPTNKKEGK